RMLDVVCTGSTPKGSRWSGSYAMRLPEATPRSHVRRLACGGTFVEERGTFAGRLTMCVECSSHAGSEKTRQWAGPTDGGARSLSGRAWYIRSHEGVEASPCRPRCLLS